MKIMIFSGTTEGRRLSEMLSENGISHFVSVATGYGSDVMDKTEYAAVRTGRMDSAGMTEYLALNGFGRDDVIVDATHPYAGCASDNVKAAAAERGCRLYRVVRKSEDDGSGSIKRYDSIEEAAAFIDKCEGNILLTTGSTTLRGYCSSVSEDTLGRTYVRVLATSESIEECRSLGIDSSRIIAMQGPFSCGMNEAVMAQYGIRHLITKESGAAGGYGEKIKAAEKLGVTCYVILRPADTDGMSIDEAFEKITGRTYERKIELIIAGAGMGSTSSITLEVMRSIGASDAVFGSKRLISTIPAARKYGMYRASDIKEVLEKNPQIRKAVVLYSGDSGFYSGAKEAVREFTIWKKDVKITVLPGLSSVSYLAAKLGVSYDDAEVISLHGRNSETELSRLADIRYYGKTFVLCSGAEDVRRAAHVLKEAGISALIFAGCRLSYDDETIVQLSAGEAEVFSDDGLVTMLIVNEEHERMPVIRMLGDDEFIRDKVPMTKECIRHESIIRLGLRKGDRVLDIGGGTGSVALEIASLDPSLSVTTIEKDDGAFALIEKNIVKLGLGNIRAIKGDALSVIGDIGRPDCVFIGGSGGELSGIISALSGRWKGIRYVADAVTLETIGELNSILEREGVRDQKITQLAVSDIHSVGGHHMMRAQNPVTIFSFTI